MSDTTASQSLEIQVIGLQQAVGDIKVFIDSLSEEVREAIKQPLLGFLDSSSLEDSISLLSTASGAGHNVVTLRIGGDLEALAAAARANDLNLFGSHLGIPFH